MAADGLIKFFTLIKYKYFINMLKLVKKNGNTKLASLLLLLLIT